MGWFTNDKDPDNILKEASSLMDKFKDIQKRTVTEIAEWNKRYDVALQTKEKAIIKAKQTFEEKSLEVTLAKEKLEQANTLSVKILSLFED